MPPIPRLIAFSAASALLIATPGPNWIYILTRATMQGRSAALLSTLGLGCGVAIHTLVTAIGLSALVASSPVAFQAVKIAGGLYLIYLGLQKILRHVQLTLDERRSSTRPVSLIGQSIVVSLTNPKTLLLFLTFLPQFVAVNAGPLLPQLLFLGGLYMLLTVSFYAALSTVAGGIGNRMLDNPVLSRRIQRLAGVIFIGLGVMALVFGV